MHLQIYKANSDLLLVGITGSVIQGCFATLPRDLENLSAANVDSEYVLCHKRGLHVYCMHTLGTTPYL